VSRRPFVLAALVLAAPLAATPSCIAPGDGDVRMRVRFGLTEPSATLPSSIDSLSVDVFLPGESEPESSIHTVENLDDADMNGRPELSRGGLPRNVPFRIRVTGRTGGAARFVGEVGPLVLGAGERRYIDIVMYPIDDGLLLERSGAAARFLHTATPLPDGRVLIAGGYDVVTSAACGAGVPPESRCFSLSATDDALIFDPATGRFHPVAGAMLEARAGHTATPLPDGRVLIAGGASAGTLAFVPQGTTSAPTGFAIRIAPLDASNAPRAHASFEIFDPEAQPEVEDVDGDGDPGRGGFVGAADAPVSPGRLDHGRFLAAAAAVPGTSRVLIAGGDGDPAAAGSYVIFDAERAGGYGVLDPQGNTLSTPRIGAAAIALGSGAEASIWIVGGAAARADLELAEVWSSTASDPDGTSVSAAMPPRMFPRQLSGAAASHPEWALYRPVAERVGDDEHALIVGWYGPSCALGSMVAATPIFAGAGETERCAYARSQLRSFVIDGTTGLAAPTMGLNGHALGASATLDDGRVVITGGISSLAWDSNPFIDLYTGELAAGGTAALDPAVRMMEVARAFHTSTALPGLGLLSFGGIRMSPDLRTITLVPNPEVAHFSAL
jgi:hypothetical protein